MKFVITGATGNIGMYITKMLLDSPHEIVAIGRNQSKLKQLSDSGASTAIGSIEDVRFLTNVFSNATAVFCMYPPVLDTNDMKAQTQLLAQNYKSAIQANNISHVVHLSSIGAHDTGNAGPVSGVHRAEQVMNTLDAVNVLHLRPAYFYTNLLANIEIIEQYGVMGSTFNQDRLPVSHYSDVAKIAADELLSLQFSGHSSRYIVSDIVSTRDVAAEIGNAIGKPQLPWIKFPEEQALQGLTAAGIPMAIALEYLELFNRIDEGSLLQDYFKNFTSPNGVTMTEFSKEFAAIYHQHHSNLINK